jgi:hypothetical protein
MSKPARWPLFSLISLTALPACDAFDVSVGANVPKGQTPTPKITALYLEAEEASSLRGFTIERDDTAENARCLAAPDDAVETDEPGPARATYDFTLEKSATYVLWGRIRSPSASSNRFWFQVDGGTWFKWRISVGDIWYWDDLHDDTDYGTPLTFALEAGAHQLVFADAVSGVELDRLYITADGDTPPGNDTPCSPPHSIELDGVCLPSCGAQRGRMCGASACAGLAHIAAYDCDVCCMGP